MSASATAFQTPVILSLKALQKGSRDCLDNKAVTDNYSRHVATTLKEIAEILLKVKQANEIGLLEANTLHNKLMLLHKTAWVPPIFHEEDLTLAELFLDCLNKINAEKNPFSFIGSIVDALFSIKEKGKNVLATMIKNLDSNITEYKKLRDFLSTGPSLAESMRFLNSYVIPKPVHPTSAVPVKSHGLKK